MKIEYITENTFWSLNWGHTSIWYFFPDEIPTGDFEKIYVIEEGNPSSISSWKPMYNCDTKTLYVPDHHECAFLTFNTRLGKLYYDKY